MEDQGKRLMLAVGIAFAIMLMWSVLFPVEPPTPAETNAVISEGGEISSSQHSGGEHEVAPASEGISAPKNAELVRGEEQFFDFEFDLLKLRFSNYGAALTSYQLLEPRLENRERNEPEDLVRVHDSKYQSMRIWFEDSTYDIPEGAEWAAQRRSDNQIDFLYESENIRVVKKIEMHPKDYLVVMTVKVELTGASAARQALAVSFYGQEDVNIESGGLFNRVTREWRAACYEDDESHSDGAKYLMNHGEQTRTGQIRWGGFDHPYFLAAASIKGNGKMRVDCNSYPLDDVVGGMGVNLILPAFDLKRGQPGINSTIAFYIGPKYRDQLQLADEISGITTDFDKSIDLGYTAIVAGPLLGLLSFFQGFVGNWGIAILLLTIVVKGLTLPWTHKSMKSMKSMANLKPQIDKIKEKYKDDRARIQIETMGLFKAHKVNPMSGCLPMILQMPIWFALYRALTVAGELYQAPFVPGWIDDLTLPDPFYIMPILLSGMMFLQTRLTPATGTGAQQQVLMYGMPIMFGGFSFFFPAGLTLYIFTNTCFTALHHLYMRKSENRPAEPGSNILVPELDSDSEEMVLAAERVANTATQTESGSAAHSPPPKKSRKNRKKRKR